MSGNSVNVPDDLTLTDRLRALICHRLAGMSDEEWRDRAGIAATDTEPGLMTLRHDGNWVVAEWPEGIELLRIPRHELTRRGVKP